MGKENMRKTDSMEYLDLKTRIKKTLNSSVHHCKLREIMNSRWISIRDFSKTPPDLIKDYQFKRIREIVAYAYKYIPLYNKKYHEVGFEPGDLKSWKDFENLPILFKEELINAFPHGIVKTKEDLNLTTRSSGSSGQFVTIGVSLNAIYEDTIQGIRQFYFQSGKGYCPSDVCLFIYTCPWWFSDIDGDYKWEYIPTTMDVYDSIKKIFEVRPKILSTYPTYLEKMCEATPKLKENGLQLIVVHSEQTTVMQRKRLSDFLQIPVFDEFSSEELTRIALECPMRNYHLEEDACYIEIVDDKNLKVLPDGNRGLVIGTNLLNTATPIIRYFQGDIATIKGFAQCDCGSNFRIMDSPQGRYMDSIITSEGEIIPAASFMDLAYNWFWNQDIPIHGLRYQIIQNENGDVDVYLIPKQYWIDKNKVIKSLYQILPSNMKITVHLVSEIPITKSVKYRPVISMKRR